MNSNHILSSNVFKKNDFFFFMLYIVFVLVTKSESPHAQKFHQTARRLSGEDKL